jgi:hypothetical protein
LNASLARSLRFHSPDVVDLNEYMKKLNEKCAKVRVVATIGTNELAVEV